MSGILLFDRGNHSLKAVLAESGGFTSRWAETSLDDRGTVKGILDSCSPDGVAFSSVVPEWTSALKNELAGRGMHPALEVGPEIRLPFEVLVDRPERLGADRICAAAGAFSMGHREAVVVDVGTAVTVDVLTSGGFLGGAIFPGIDLILASLNEGTVALPRISEIDRDPALPGRDTEEAMTAGAVWGMAGAVRALVAKSMESVPPGTGVILTGGGAGLLEGHLEVPVEIDPDLVFRGLLLLFEMNI